jgi:hypothetical protein
MNLDQRLKLVNSQYLLNFFRMLTLTLAKLVNHSLYIHSLNNP